MYSVLIVDDEEIVRKGLCHIIEWEKYKFKVCGDAAGGKTAIEKIEEYKPDLVLLDINMPRITGIDILERYHKQLSDDDTYTPLFLILSGYSDFEYAQKAVNNGASGYLLKPVDGDLLIDKLREISEILSTRNQIDKIRNSIFDIGYQKKIEKMLLFGSVEDAFENPAVGDMNKYQVLLISSVCCGFIGRIQQLQKTVSDFFPYAEVMFFTQDPVLIAVIQNTPENTVLRYTTRFCKKFSSIAGGAVAALGPAGTGLQDALQSYKIARELFSQLFFSEEKEFLQTADYTPSSQELLKPNPLLPHVPDFLLFMETGNIPKMRNFLLKQKDLFCNGGYTAQNVKKMFIAFIIEIQNQLHEKYHEKQIPYVAVMDLINQVHAKNYFLDVFTIVKKIIWELTASLNQGVPDSVIKKMIEYIQHNYHADLRLENFGEVFNYNSGYLGKKFKRVTGMYFNTYIDFTRMKEAKKLLKSTDLKVSEVSERVGYTETDYFYRKFRKYVRMTPTEFRNNDIL